MTSPESAARVTWQMAGVDPHLGVNLHRIASLLGVQQVVFDGPADGSLGCLELAATGPIIRVPSDGSSTEVQSHRQRFTFAHELGHVALYRLDGLGPAQQVNKPALEKWCDRYASQLLAPSSAVRRTFSEPTSLDVVERLSKRAAISATSAFLALNRQRTTPDILLRFEISAGRWRLMASYGTRAGERVGGTVSTAQALNSVPMSGTHQRTIPLQIAGRIMEIFVDTRRSVDTAWVLVSRSALRDAALSE